MVTISMVTISMAGVMAVAVALAVPEAEAAFLYVPPHEPAPTAVEAGDGEVGSAVSETVDGEGRPPTAVEASIGDPNPGLWHVRPGETLREVLGRWGGRTGIEVLFLTDRRYRLHEGRTFAGPFAEAADSLFATLSHLPHPPVGERRSDGLTLAVLHRSRPAGDGQ